MVSTLDSHTSDSQFKFLWDFKKISHFCFLKKERKNIQLLKHQRHQKQRMPRVQFNQFKLPYLALTAVCCGAWRSCQSGWRSSCNQPLRPECVPCRRCKLWRWRSHPAQQPENNLNALLCSNGSGEAMWPMSCHCCQLWGWHAHYYSRETVFRLTLLVPKKEIGYVHF